MMSFKFKLMLGFFVVVVIVLSSYFYRPVEKNVSVPEIQEANIELTTYDSDNKLYTEHITKTPQRVIAVWQTSIETLLALGQEDKIIAAIGLPNDKCLKEEYREVYHKIPYKSFNTLNQEATLAMQPDFILTSWASSLSAKRMGRTDFWNQRKVGTYISELPPAVGGKRTIKHEYKYIRDMGRLFGVENRAESIIASINEEILNVTANLPVQNNKRKQVMVIQFMGDKLKNWGDDYLQGDIVENLNGDLVVKESKFIGYEDLLAANPEIIFLMANEWEYNNIQAVYDKLVADRRFTSLQAVKNKRVYIIPLYLGQYSAVRLGEGIRLFAQGMYPEFYQ